MAEFQPVELQDEEPFSLELPIATFVYSDPSMPLRYSARGTRGGPLPAWIHFDSVRRRFIGTAPPGVSELDVIVTASDNRNHRAQTLVTLDFH